MNWHHAIRLRRAGLMVFGGFLGAVSLTLAMAAQPANDMLAAAEPLGQGLPITASGDNTGATLEANEWNFGGSSVWYSWTAPSSGWVAVDTIAGNGTAQIDTVVGVYTGSAQASLLLVGFNDEAWAATSASKLAFDAVAGTTYRIAVFGYSDGTSVAQGAFTLHLTGTSPDVRVTGIFVSSASVDVSTAPQTVNMTVTITSNSDLFTIAAPSFLLRDPDGWGLWDLLPVPIVAADRISGNSTLGTYQKTVAIPRGIRSGSWIPSLQIAGSSGTNVWSRGGGGSYQDHWVISGIAPLLSVLNTGAVDLDPPALTAFSLSPASAAPYEKVTMNLTITDAGGAGFQKADIWLANGGAWLAGVTAADRISGDASSGNYVISFAVPSHLAPGSYPLEIWVGDAAANWNGYDGTVSGDILASHPLVIGTDSIIDGWRRQHFGSTGNAGVAASSADPDQDGTVNLLEFATNHDPNASDSAVTSVTSAGGLLTLSYSRSLAAVAAGVQFLAEWSDSPGGPWSTKDVTEAVTASDSAADQVQASVSLGSSPHRFMRLRASLTP